MLPRAKTDRPPRRPLFRRGNIILLVPIASVIWAAYSFVRITTLQPGHPGKYNAELVKLVEDAQSDSAGQPNSWDFFIQTINLSRDTYEPLIASPKPKGWRRIFGWPPGPEDAWMPEAGEQELAVFRSVIKLYKDAGLLEMLDKLALAKRFVAPIPDGTTLGTSHDWLGTSRSMARLCKARMYFAILDKDDAEFIRSTTHLLAIANTCKSQATIMDQLVGAAIDAMTAGTIRDAARDHALSEPTCRELLALLSTRVTQLDVDRGIDASRLFTRDFIEWTHSDEGDGDGRPIPVELDSRDSFAPSTKPRPRFNIENLGSIGRPSKKQTNLAFDKFFEVARSLAHASLRERAGVQTPSAYADALSNNYKLVKILGPSLERFIEFADRMELELAGTRIMLALELHNMSHAGYPASLADLDPPLSSLHIPKPWIQEIVYKRFQPGEDKAPPGTRPYLLYWIGLDNTDDHGAVTGKNDDGSDEAWKQDAAGCDFVFNAPKPLPKPPDPDDELE